MSRDAHGDAERFCELFPAAYLAFHRRDGKRDQLTGASRAVLLHLAQTGPVTVGEASAHLDRAQSVVSEIVSQLESHGLVERETDPGDRRRTLVWLTDAGRARLTRDSQVLDVERVARALATLSPSDRRRLNDSLATLVSAAGGGEPATGIPATSNPPRTQRKDRA